MEEIKRIEEAYERRDRQNKKTLYSLFNTASLFAEQEKERAILSSFRAAGINCLSAARILEVGCGNGSVLRKLMGFGASPENCFGIDLLAGKIEEARRLSPNMDFRCGNAERLPYSNGSFDMILCFTVFSSIFDRTMKRNLALEMGRVLGPEGLILWYDFHVDNPKNRDVRGIRKRELRALFHGFQIRLRRITLAPPLARALAPHLWLFCYLLERLKVFNTHYICVIKKGFWTKR